MRTHRWPYGPCSFIVLLFLASRVVFVLLNFRFCFLPVLSLVDFFSHLYRLRSLSFRISFSSKFCEVNEAWMMCQLGWTICQLGWTIYQLKWMICQLGWMPACVNDMAVRVIDMPAHMNNTPNQRFTYAMIYTYTVLYTYTVGMSILTNFGKIERTYHLLFQGG